MSFRTKAPLLAVTALVSAFGFASTAYADAFYLQAQSARGAGRAFSGEAADTGAASLWWNPAAIAGSDSGSTIRQSVRRPLPPRSDDASSSEFGIRSSPA